MYTMNYKRLCRWMIFNVFYLLLSVVSLETRDPWGLSSTIWLPSGLVLGVLSIAQYTHWPVWVVTVVLLHVATSLMYGRPLEIAIIFAIVDIIVLCPLAHLWKSLLHKSIIISYRSRITIFIISIYAFSIFGGVFSEVILNLSGYPILLSHYVSWSISNAAGCVAIAPFFIMKDLYKKKDSKSSFFYSLFRVCILISIPSLFYIPHHYFSDELFCQLFLYFIFVITVAISFYWRGAPLSIYYIYSSILISISVMYGYGPFSLENVQLSQLYLVVIISFSVVISVNETEWNFKCTFIENKLNITKALLCYPSVFFFKLSLSTRKIYWENKNEVLGIPTNIISTYPLLLSRIHPEERQRFSASIERGGDKPVLYRLRFFFDDNRYRYIKICIKSDTSDLLGGVLINDEEI